MTGNPKTPWQERVLGLLEADLKIAESAMAERQLTPEKAKAFVRKSSSVGIIDFNPGAPAFLRDPKDPACHTFRLLLLIDDLKDANEQASNTQHLLLGQLWARAGIGMQFPEIAKAMDGYWLNQRRGPGARATTDLIKTLQNRVASHPNEEFDEVLNFLKSDYAEDCFYQSNNPMVHIVGVDVREDDRIVIYDDRSRTKHEIKFASLERALRKIKNKK